MCKEYKVEKFYKWETNLRKIKNQPPFSNFISIISSSKFRQNAFNELENMKIKLKKKFTELNIYGPAPSVIEKKNNLYRFRLFLNLIRIIKNKSK